MDRFTRSLEEVGSESLSTVGGKGSNLGELVRAGFPVPRAFCIATEAYRELLSRNALLAEILTALDGVDYELPADVERRAARIRELITTAAVPEEITSSIAAGYGRLEEELGAGVPVSVRSSATAEDLPGSSFAGQQDTYLNVSGGDDVVDHTKRCWASLWTDRADRIPASARIRARGCLPRGDRSGDVPLGGLRRPVHGQSGHVEPARAVPQCQLGSGRGGGLRSRGS